jgi:hypothetical protein
MPSKKPTKQPTARPTKVVRVPTDKPTHHVPTARPTNSEKCYDAFGRGPNYCCFLDAVVAKQVTEHNWGWTNLVNPKIKNYEFQLYSNALGCNPQKGIRVGKVTIVNDVGKLVMSIKVLITVNHYRFNATFVYVGLDRVPKKDAVSTTNPRNYPLMNANGVYEVAIPAEAKELYVIVAANVCCF